MKTLKIICITLIIASLNFSAYSQIDDNTQRSRSRSFVHKKDSKHALGIAAGATTGFGLSYQYMPNQLSFQLAFFPYKDQSSSLISAGLTFIYRLREGEKLNFLLYQGNHFISQSQTNYGWDPVNQVSVETGKSTTSGFNNGVGIGFEFFLSESVAFNLMTGYAGYNNFERITLTGEGALFYKF